jgi:hypothetical protein
MVSLAVQCPFIKNPRRLSVDDQWIRKLFRKTLQKACSNQKSLATFASRLQGTGG